MTNTNENYFTEIEDHFRAARGTGLFMLSPLDWALIDAWKNAGVPLEAVLRGIDVAFEKWRRRPARARTNNINSLAYCAQPIATEAMAMANVTPIARTSAGASLSLDDIRAFVGRNAAAVRAAGHCDLVEALESMDLDALSSDVERLEQHLTVIEGHLIARVREAASEETLLAARRALDRELKPYRGKMSAEQLVMLEQQFLERRLLESAGLPRLSLFYL